MKALKLLIVIACTLNVGWLRGQIIDIDTMKYGCGTRSDLVTNNSLTYKITKGADEIIYSNRINVNSLAGNIYPYKYAVYYSDTLLSNLTYTALINNAMDSTNIVYIIDSTKSEGAYFIKYYFNTESGTYASSICLNQLLSPVCYQNSCQLVINSSLDPNLGYNTSNTFISDVNCWTYAWGSPQADVQHAAMWAGYTSFSQSILGEGIRQFLPVYAGKQYALEIKAKLGDYTNVPTILAVELLASALNTTVPGPGSTGDPIPVMIGQNLLLSAITNSTSYLSYTSCFTSNSNANELVIYPKPVGVYPSVAWLSVSSVQLYDVTPKSETYTVTCANPAQIGNFPCQIPNATFSWAPVTGLSNPNILNPIASPAVTTNYTLTVSSSICSYTSTSTVYVTPPIPLTISVANSQTICTNTSATLTAVGGTNYNWIPTGQVTNSIVVAPSTATTYSVNSVDVNGCVTSTAVTIYVYPNTLQTITSVQSLCPNAQTLLTALSAGTNYVWQPGNITANPIAVNPATTTNYTVSSTSVDGCIITTSITVNPITCCYPDLTTGTIDLDALTLGSSIANNQYRLNGTKNLPANFDITDCRIYCGTNGELVVPNNGVLTISGSHLLGCPTMWKGIRCVGPNATIKIINNLGVNRNTLIEDAITAIDLKNVLAPASGQTQILITNDATFNKNYIGINIDTYTTTTGAYPSDIQNTVFTSRKLITPEHIVVTPSLTVTYPWPIANNMTQLKQFPPVTSVNTIVNFNPNTAFSTTNQFSAATYSTANCEIPYQGNTANIGIALQNVYSPTLANYIGFELGTNPLYTSATTLNLFDNLTTGVSATNANFKSANAGYQNMHQAETPAATELGSFSFYNGGEAISAKSTLAYTQSFSLSVQPTLPGFNTTSNIFIHNVYAVKSINLPHVTISYMIGHSRRTYAANSLPQANVPMDLGSYGVYVKTYNYKNISINSNFMANLAYGIVFIADYKVFGFIKTVNAQFIGPVFIANNTLKANYGATIASQSMLQAIAIDNILNQTTIGGIVIGTPALVFINNNNIHDVFNGIIARNWNRQRVIDNSNTITLKNDGTFGFRTRTQTGITHQNNTADNMIGNTVVGFGLAKVQVYAINAADCHAQTVWCNQTQNTYEGFRFSGAQNLTNWKGNKMTNHKRGMHLNNTTIGTQGSATVPINNTWIGPWTGNFKTFVTALDPATSAPNSNLYLSNIPTAVFNSGNLFSLRYKTITPVSLFNASGPGGVTCPSISTGTVIGGGLMPFTGNLRNIVNQNYNYGVNLAGNRKNGKMATYRALLMDSTLMVGDTTLQYFFAQAKTSNIGKHQLVQNTLALGDIATAKSINTAIVPTDLVEQNTKRFYDLYITSKQSSLSVSDEADLLTLANGCPAKEGTVVYQARVLRNSYHEIYENYEDNCDSITLSSARMAYSDELNDVIINDNFIVYPNPSSGKVFFTADNLGLKNYTINVFDITGKQVYTQYFTDGLGIKNLNLSLPNGLYSIQLSNENETYLQKLVIVQ